MGVHVKGPSSAITEDQAHALRLAAGALTGKPQSQPVFMDALVWLILFVASPDALRQKWIYIASLRVGLICGVAVAICIYSPGWSLVLGSEADEWRGFYGYILAFNAVGGTAVTLGAWALSPLLGRPARVSGEVAQPGKSYYRVD